MKILLLIVIFTLLLQFSGAIILQGEVYNIFSFDPLKNTIIDINTIPNQRIVSDGTYQFDVPKGAYKITAKHFDRENNLRLQTEDILIVNSEGNFVYDLILSPTLEEISNEDLNLEMNISFPNGSKNSPKIPDNSPIFLIILPILVILIIGGYLGINKFVSKKQKEPKNPDVKIEENINDNEFDKYSKEVIDILKRCGNRLSQKDLRNKMSVGEAKVSLIISELESIGIIKKIKKGRGNIIILKRRIL